MVDVSESELAELRTDAEKWREVTSDLEDENIDSKNYTLVSSSQFAEFIKAKEKARRLDELQRPGTLPNLDTLAGSYRRLREIEERARKELDLAKVSKQRHPQQSKLLAEVVSDIMGWDEPEWVKK